MQQKYAALYCRLSVDDGSFGGSVSIETQKILLEQYCQSRSITEYKFYCDDGYSGTNFDRPAFRQLLSDIHAGKIDLVIVKDLSRFGRNYVEVGLQVEHFKEQNVRFIAADDHYDSKINEDDLMSAAIKSWHNERCYARLDILPRVCYNICNTMKGGSEMTYELRHFDTPLMRFTATEDTSSPEIEILWVNDEKKALLPLDMNADGDSVSRWLRHRTIPKNRAYVHSFLSKCGLNLNRPMSILSVSKGLSLNDCYWVVEERFEGGFAEYNLYENRFSRVLGLIAFTGYGSSVRTSLASCPEFTTNGMLPKCWRRENGVIRLYKGGTSGASNTGNEPYSEFYAAQIAEVLGINAIPYGLSKWKGELCSTCELFTSKDYSFIPVGRLVTKGGMQAVREYCESLGEAYINALDDMLVLDAVICNVDRHFGNFGFLVDNRTNTITAPAPLFDHGNSLFNLAGRDDFVSDKELSNYADTLVPCVYDDFIGAAKKVLNNKHKDGLRRLLDFRFKRHSRYNLDSKRLKLIENQMHKRAKELLG